MSTLTAYAQNPPAATATPEAKTYRTLYLIKVTQENDAEDLTTNLRNLLPDTRIYYVASQNAIFIIGSAEDIALAQKILFDLDKTKLYRLTRYSNQEAARQLLGQVLYPRFPRALFGLDPLAATFDPQALAPDFDLKQVRQAVVEFLRSYDQTHHITDRRL